MRVSRGWPAAPHQAHGLAATSQSSTDVSAIPHTSFEPSGVKVKAGVPPSWASVIAVVSRSEAVSQKWRTRGPPLAAEKRLSFQHELGQQAKCDIFAVQVRNIHRRTQEAPVAKDSSFYRERIAVLNTTTNAAGYYAPDGAILLLLCTG